MRTITMLLLTAGLMLLVDGAGALENNGAEKMVLTGGSRGNVPFPHLQHQKRLGDCNVCHRIFPQQKGAIEKLKAEGALKHKQVMNKLCTGCHRQTKRDGQSSGPVTCNSCHIR